MAPGTCARVTAIALFELDLDFQFEVVRFMTGQHKSPEYRQLNPLGKVPALVFDGQVITENVAILNFLNQRYGSLLPLAEDDFKKAEQLADLCFCSSTLHPVVTRIRIPHMFSDESHAKTVKEKACAFMNPYFERINERLRLGEWWYGDEWSIMDAYLFWVFWRVEGAGFDFTHFPHYVAHARKMEQRESVIKAIEIEDEAQSILEREGLKWTPPKVD